MFLNQIELITVQHAIAVFLTWIIIGSTLLMQSVDQQLHWLLQQKGIYSHAFLYNCHDIFEYLNWTPFNTSFDIKITVITRENNSKDSFHRYRLYTESNYFYSYSKLSIFPFESYFFELYYALDFRTKKTKKR